MYAVATFLVVAALTVTFTKLATGALIATGVPPEIASFQSRSAFSGAGFTTTEAENVINHPTRRKIIGTTMLVGNLGTPTLVVTVLIGLLASAGPGSTTERTLVIISGVILIVLAVTNGPTERGLTRLGERYAQRRLLPALEHEVDELLVLDDEFIVGARRVGEEPGDTQRSLRGLDEAFPGCTVLGVWQGEQYIGASPADIDLGEGDVLVIYGRRELVRNPPTP